MSHVPSDLSPPEPIRLPASARAVAAACVLLGACALGWAWSAGHSGLAWSAYLIGAFYALSLGVFGVLWVSILYLSKAAWSVTMRRIPESMGAWLVPGGILALLVGLGGHDLYHWTHADAVAADPLLAHKAPFLNLPMFYGLVAASVLAWAGFGLAMNRNSRRQDDSGSAALSRTNTVLSAAFVVLFALSFSIVSFYLLMSLEAHWFSTMYAVLMFTDVIQTGTAFVAVVASALMLRGRLAGWVDENHLHSLAKMMFAATGFWAYIYFCQYMLIWYGNLPEETSYFLTRTGGGWAAYLVALPLLKFVVPFVVMVPRNNKRRPRRVLAMALLILFAQFWELLLLVSPAVSHGGVPAHAHLPWVEAAATAGFVGLFFLVFAWSLGRHGAVPLKDPRLRECLEYHQ